MLDINNRDKNGVDNGVVQGVSRQDMLRYIIRPSTVMAAADASSVIAETGLMRAIFSMIAMLCVSPGETRHELRWLGHQRMDT